MLNPSPSNSPSFTPQDLNSNRKRLRSLSLESESSSSSPKRSMSQDPSLDTHDTPRANDLPTPPAEDSEMTSTSAADVQMAFVGDGNTITPPPERSETTGGHSPLTAKQKYDKITALVKREMQEGETWYVVSRRWYRRWEKACTGEVDKEGGVEEKELGPVDNGHLVDLRGNLTTQTVTEGVDVEFVPEEAWELFVKWYGPARCPIPRKVIERGAAHMKTLELFPPRLYAHILVDNDAMGQMTPSPPVEVRVSSGNTVSEVREALLKAVFPDSQEKEYRIWDLNGKPAERKYVSLNDLAARQVKDQLSESEELLSETILEDGDSFAVEVRRDGKWLVTTDVEVALHQDTQPADVAPPPLFKTGNDFFSKLQTRSTSSAPTTKTVAIAPSKDPRPAPKVSNVLPGTLGLGNMGNTCFMNSAIQCLVHTPELADYFLTGVFEKELNPDNPLGMHGAIAEAFGALLKKIWVPTSSATSYSPREFKSVLSRFAPQFSGYQQHDSQELVAFLLDGLHEDLNRVLKKPYVEKPDWEGGGDKELVAFAKESWNGYMKRNDSVIVDLFQGQYQSTLVCPECRKVSITFDPFMYLTLPLPVQKKWKHAVHYIPWDVEKPHLKMDVEINRDSGFKELRALIGRWMDVNPDNLLTLEIFNHRFYKNLDDNTIVGDMSESDIIVCYELPCHSQQSRSHKRTDEDPIIVPVFLGDTPSRARTSYGGNAHTYFGYPFLIVLDQAQAQNYDAVYDAIVDRLQRWTTQVRDLYQWEAGPAPTSMEEVPITLSSGPTLESVTEIKENGDVVTVQEVAPEEGDIVDEKSVVIQEQGYESMDTSDDAPRRLGFKRGLFHPLIYGKNAQYAVGYGGMSGSKAETLEQRAEAADEENPYLLRDGDAILAEFDEHTKAYYFGESSKFEHATWTIWEEFLHPEIKAAREAASQKKSVGISLQDCLDEFTKEEQLGEDDLWYCPRCKKHQQATKRFDIWSVPDVLVVHLKRFSNSRILRDKIDTFVDFPVTGLDLTSMVGERKVAKNLEAAGEDLRALGLEDTEEPLVYDLFAVDEHLGGLGGGHYRAFAHNSTDDKWYHFDDSYVTPTKPENAVNRNAYLLFYRRRTSRPLGGKTHEIIEAARTAAAQEAPELPDSQLQDVKMEDIQLPTPPADDIPELPVKLPELESFTSRQKQFLWRPAASTPDEWENSSTSPASTPPTIDESDRPPSFEDAQLDPIVQSNLTPLELSTQFDFPDPISRGSPSSVQAEFDTEQDADDLDGIYNSDDSGSRNIDGESWQQSPSVPAAVSLEGPEDEEPTADPASLV